MAKKQPFKQGEKLLFAIFGAFFVAAVIGYAVMETVRLRSDKPMFASRTHYDLSEEGKRGSLIFRKKGCTACHRALRNGTNMGLELDGIGSRRSQEWLLGFLEHPEQTYGGATVDHGLAPKEAAYVAGLPKQDLQAIAMFLSELKADQGSPSAPMPPSAKSGFIDNMVKMWAPKNWKNEYQDVRTTMDDAEEGR